ncbi:uncharacterized protein LOC130995314 [Salvia miltiorrhiza]|uniref:uncharacterized protein LOC130995314 n=1 Tax=Salvia miltiorrhiza TaxID=226208 RepID=UPI0025ABF33E|nr:uncharacterized protein LOC130995314 [Salvia miltiorrhiza]XP_057776537.1 uncharacterized protein LOC130995314 [Salvia miltiorrhiza]
MSTGVGRDRRGGSSSAASSCASSTLPASSSDVELEPTSSEILSSNDKRIPLLRMPGGELALHKDFSSVITKTFTRIPNPTGINWKATPEDVKNQYFEEFRKRYSWDESWEDEVRHLWEKRASIMFPDFLYDVKVCRKPNGEGKRKLGYICDDQWKMSHLHSQNIDTRFEEIHQQLQEIREHRLQSLQEGREHRLRMEESLRVMQELVQQFIRSQQSRSSGSGGPDFPGDNL